MLYIRADGNAEIGTGHIMRCLSIAEAVRREGENCTFIVADENMTLPILQHEFPYINLKSQWNDLDQEIDKVERIINQERVKTLLLDSYFVTSAYLSALSPKTRLCYIDDLNAFLYTCHTLINYNIYADLLDYPSRYPHTTLLLGPQYAPLREEFQKVPAPEIPLMAKDVLITTGGMDPYAVTVGLLDALVSKDWFPDVQFHIICGRFNPYKKDLLDYEKIYPNIHILINVEKISKLMQKSDVAVSAGGSTLYELCACGVPTILFTLADNQLQAARTFSKKGIMYYSGDIRENRNKCIGAIVNNMENLLTDSIRRTQMSQLMRNLVDCQGAERLAKQILLL